MSPQEGHFRRFRFRVDKKPLYSLSGNKHPPGLFIRYHVQREIRLAHYGQFASHA